MPETSRQKINRLTAEMEEIPSVDHEHEIDRLILECEGGSRKLMHKERKRLADVLTDPRRG